MDKVLAKMYIRKDGKLFQCRDVYIRKDGGFLPLRKGLYGIGCNGVLYVSDRGKVVKRVRKFTLTFDSTFG